MAHGPSPSIPSSLPSRDAPSTSPLPPIRSTTSSISGRLTPPHPRPQPIASPLPSASSIAPHFPANNSYPSTSGPSPRLLQKPCASAEDSSSAEKRTHTADPPLLP